MTFRALRWLVYASLAWSILFNTALCVEPNDLLVAAGKRIAVASLTGQQHPALQAMAQRHADYQASVGVQGHQNWDARMAELARQIPECRHFVEVAAESWPDQAPEAAAAEMYTSWRQSPGHWKAVDSPATAWGYAMAYSPAKRTWYAAGIFGYANYRVDVQGFRQGVVSDLSPVVRPAGRNFVVSAPTPEIAAQIRSTAERVRRELAIDWLGAELPNWAQPCPITAKVSDQLGAGGTTGFLFENGEVYDWKMVVQGRLQRILDSVIPHEVLHTIFATHFRQPLPRWADEGAASSIEHASQRNKLDSRLIEFLRSGRGIAFTTMLTADEYPADILPLYAQGHSAAAFLIESRGRRAFVQFLEDVLAGNSYIAPLKDHYGFESAKQFQDRWLSWVAAGSPLPKARLAGYQPCANGQCQQWDGGGWQKFEPTPFYNTMNEWAVWLKEHQKQLENCKPGERGPQGATGERGPEGPPGKCDGKDVAALTLKIEQLTARVAELEKRPQSFTLNISPNDSRVVEMGGEVSLPPILVRQIDRNGAVAVNEHGEREEMNVWLSQKMNLRYRNVDDVRGSGETRAEAE